MTDNQITEIIQQWFLDDDNSCEKLFVSQTQNTTKSFIAMRLINTYGLYKKDAKYKMDFECALRNYLLSFGTSIVIPDYKIIDTDYFGLIQNGTGGRINAHYSLPSYVNFQFARKVFECIKCKREEISYSCFLNPYIYHLTNKQFRMFKSVEQQLAVMGALRTPSGYTALVAMSTGGGKSLMTYTLAYQVFNSLTVVVVPTISLMLDQYRNAERIIKPTLPNEIMYYYSGCNVDEVVNAITQKQIRLLFLSPETIIKNRRVRDSLLSAAVDGYFKNLVVDEAHIVVEWGSSFRMDFQCLDAIRKQLVKNNPELRTFLFSATFSKKTIDDLKNFYSDKRHWVEIRLDALRSELHFDIIRSRSRSEKSNRIMELVCKLPHPIIIYVNTPDDADILQSHLEKIGFNNSRCFTGRTGNAKRKKIIEEWINNKFDIMIATCAFGVGVDKPDVRTVLHTYIPSSPNQYYQECGRGGRDGLACLNAMTYISDDIDAAKSLMQKVLTVEKMSGRWFSMLNSDKTYKRINEVIIDTSVKPNYSDNAVFYTEANNADIAWNVYVILLFRRSDLLSIEKASYVDGKYIFTVKIKNRSILFNDETAKQIISSIRAEEFRCIRSDILELTSALKKVGNVCWSTMFNDVYTLTDEYCAGCNQHDGICKEHANLFPLRKPVSAFALSTTEKIKEIIGGEDEQLILCEGSFLPMIIRLTRAGVDTVVIPDDMSLEINQIDTDNSKLMIMGYKEFFELSREDNSVYLSGSILFCLGDNSKLAEKILLVTSHKQYCRIYLVHQDLDIIGRNKKMSELVNGTCKRDYIIKKGLD